VFSANGVGLKTDFTRQKSKNGGQPMASIITAGNFRLGPGRTQIIAQRGGTYGGRYRITSSDTSIGQVVVRGCIGGGVSLSAGNSVDVVVEPGKDLELTADAGADVHGNFELISG
jgi:hypothetical protein